MSSLPIGAGLFSVRDYLKQDMPGTLKQVAAMGFDGVEFFGDYHAYTPEAVNAALKDAGLTLCGWHTGWEMLDEAHFDETVAFYKAVNNHFVIVPYYAAETLEDWKEFARQLNSLKEKLAPHGMQVGYHNHNHEFKAAAGGQTPFDAIFDNVQPGVVMQLDTGNAMDGGACPVAVLKAHPGLSTTIHLKPYSKADGFATMIGRDDTPWQEIFNLCEANGTTWYILEYEDALYDQMEGLKLCIEGMRKLGK